MPSSLDFVHLHVHTDYSLLDGACAIDCLCKQASDLGMKAIAITDHGNLFGLVDFFQTAKKQGIQPLLGCEIYMVYDHKMTEKPDRTQNKYYHMGLLAQNLTGYQNLTKLVSKAHTQGFYYKPRVDMETLAQYAEGLIGFTGCLNGVVPRFLLQGEYDKAREAMGRFLDIFTRERYFVELQDHGLEEQQRIIPGLLQLAQEFNVKVICSNDVHYVRNTDWAAHDSLLCIQTGAKLSDEKRLRYTAHQFYLKSAEEMALLFKDNPEALTNTRLVAEMCNLELPFGKNHYPVFKRDESALQLYTNNFEYIHALCKTGLKERYNVDYAYPENNDDPAFAKMLIERLNYELKIIEKSGFIDYFLIVWDFIYWTRGQGIPVGPGRGSGAGCLVAYLLKITDIDPIRFKLLFERFLNPERISPPDFDIDFCMRRRSEVIEYVRKKYGHDAVANIITFGTFGAKMIVRDLARINDLPYSEGDRLAKMIPEDLGTTLSSAIERSSELQVEIRKNPMVSQIVSQGQIIEGMVRNVGTHAAGIIIADRPLTEFVPVTLQDGVLTTQYSKDPVEALGLLKMDFLGLKTLTLLADAQSHIRRVRNDPSFDIEKVDFEDAPTFKLLNEARTVGVFQLESGGMQSLCRQFSISSIDEIVALIALYRPGPMDLIPDYIKGKNDPKTIRYPHPLLEGVCRETYGIMVYQEQVMEAAQLIAGYSLGGADILRRAMGKKKPEEMAKQRQVFLEGAKKHNNIPNDKADVIFNLLEKFSGYGFNKSHSAAYAILSYRTAYLKANYPVEFMAAVLSSELGNADKLTHFLGECIALQIQVLSPDINESRQDFTPVGRSIRFGLAGIKGVGDAAAIKILEERDAHGPFTSFWDFIQRIDTRSVNKRVLECLAKTGAFDTFNIDRQHLLSSIEGHIQAAAALQKDKSTGQGSLFDLMDTTTTQVDTNVMNTSGPCMSLADKLSCEKELLGFYISGHPMNDYQGIANAINTFKACDLQQLHDQTPFRLCGIISGLNKRISKKDNRPWAFFNLCDQAQAYAINVFPETYEKDGTLLAEGALVMVEGVVRSKDNEVRLNANKVGLLDDRLSGTIKSIELRLQPNASDTLLEDIGSYIHSNEGGCRLRFGFVVDGKVLHAEPASSLTFQFNAQTFQRWRQHPAISDVKLETTPIFVPAPRYQRNSKA